MSYEHLTEKERYVISHLRSTFSLREIARRLGRHHTTIMREIKRNGPDYPDAVYWYYVTQPVAEKRRHQPRVHRRQEHSPLVAYIEDKLRLDWPPEAISARLRLDHPDDAKMRICHETIYRWIYLDASQGGDLHQHLRRRRKNRRRQTRYGNGRRFLPGRVSIHERPEVVESRSRFGDWEGDTLEGAKGCGHLATLVERKSRFLLAAKLPDKKSATMTDASVKAFWQVPKTMRHTLTLDNGKEFSQFKELEARTGLSVYFADPYAAWQRGTNENTNGLLRHYFPKGFDFRTVSDEDLDRILKQVNNRPRKCLGYRSLPKSYGSYVVHLELEFTPGKCLRPMKSSGIDPFGQSIQFGNQFFKQRFTCFGCFLFRFAANFCVRVFSLSRSSLIQLFIIY